METPEAIAAFTQLRDSALATVALADTLLAKLAPAAAPASPPLVVATGRVPENPAGAVPGLNFAYYQSTFTTVPDFTKLKPTSTGFVLQPAAVIPGSRADFYGLQLIGFLSVPADGEYTLYTTSDDGSLLFIGDKLVVDNNGGHAVQERSGKIMLQKGAHALTIGYYEYNGDQQLSVSWSGPGLPKAVIPAAAYSRLTPLASAAAVSAPAVEKFTATPK